MLTGDWWISERNTNAEFKDALSKAFAISVFEAVKQSFGKTTTILTWSDFCNEFHTTGDALSRKRRGSRAITTGELLAISTIVNVELSDITPSRQRWLGKAISVLTQSAVDDEGVSIFAAYCLAIYRELDAEQNRVRLRLPLEVNESTLGRLLEERHSPLRLDEAIAMVKHVLDALDDAAG